MRLLTLAVDASALLLVFGFGGTVVLASPDSERITPVMLAVQDAPVPFVGSDGRVHLVYELWLQNFSSGNVTVEKVEILGDGGAVIRTLNAAEIAGRLQPAGFRESAGLMASSTAALLFIHVR